MPGGWTSAWMVAPGITSATVPVGSFSDGSVIGGKVVSSVGPQPNRPCPMSVTRAMRTTFISGRL